MKDKKIIDYIILDGSLPPYKLFNRIDLPKKEIVKEIDTLKVSLERSIERLDRFKFLNDEYGKYEVGKEYKVLTRDELKEWSSKANNGVSHNESSYPHPLQSIIPQDLEVTVEKYDYNNNSREIKNALNKAEKTVAEKRNKIIQLEKELKEFESDPDPISNTHTRTTLEIQVIELVNRGYLPLGGISVSEGNSYQTMVKYEE